MKAVFDKEIKIEKYLRHYKWLVPLVTLLAAGLLYTGIYWCVAGFRAGYYFTVIPAGILAHAFMIITVHDGAHKALTRTAADRLIMNLGASLILIPFYAEPFRKYHLTHHANTNTAVDPLWPEFKREMYKRRRWLYLICECIPILFTMVLVLSGKQKQNARVVLKQPKVKAKYMIAAILFSLALIVWVKPPALFVVGLLFILNLTGALRHWCEHMGIERNKESNTFWFPLGMGIGNHEAHHLYPHFSWLTMMIGLFSRKRDTNPVKALRALLVDCDFVHYEKTALSAPLLTKPPADKKNIFPGT